MTIEIRVGKIARIDVDWRDPEGQKKLFDCANMLYHGGAPKEVLSEVAVLLVFFSQGRKVTLPHGKEIDDAFRTLGINKSDAPKKRGIKKPPRKSGSAAGKSKPKRKSNPRKRGSKSRGLSVKWANHQ